MSDYSESWQPSCDRSSLRGRAVAYKRIRDFFESRSVLEVETPILGSASATDPYLDSIDVHAGANAPQISCADTDHPHTFYLHTSPEFAMKRLLASGSGDIYQICKTFRRFERGTRHNPEFSMLEWYRLDFSLEQLMQEVYDLATLVTQQNLSFERVSYREAFLTHLDLDPFQTPLSHLQSLCAQHYGEEVGQLEANECLDLLLSHHIEPKLGQNGHATFLCEYPAEQAALAKVKEDAHGNRVAQRFELYLQGLEIANGYKELTDPVEQRRRFEADNRQRQALGKADVQIDEYLLTALKVGLPDCAGVALGLDRLLMIAGGYKAIDEVLSFPIDRA